MKKKYNKKITQYDLEGNILNTFQEPSKASHIVNYDSIINCCLGKYKTAGGYVWRFDGDEFNINNNKQLKNTFKCSICNSEETARTMALHLKWVHNTTTEKYINKYGEFRPKYLKTLEKQSLSNIQCQICGQKLNSNQHLMYHLSKSHPETSKSEYIMHYFLDDIQPLCKCGCEQPVTILENGKNCDLDKNTYHRDYVKGHWDWKVFSGIKKQSKEEIELVDYLTTIYPEEIQTSVRDILPKTEIDIYLPQLKIGIEYNGLYWHSEKNGKFSDYHITKTKISNNLGIRLIHIFSDEWINKKEITKQKLNSIINPIKPSRIYARKCIVKEISPNDKNIFLNQYHIQGEDRSSIKLGLFNNDELISVMTFSNPRVSLGGNHLDKTSYELSRFASKKYVCGGSAKLLSFFIKNYSPKSIYSYSDNRWTDPNNNMYLKLGFNIEKQSSPNYFYTKNYLTRFHRYNFTKQRLNKMGADIENKTEYEIMKELGYTKIWDCGTTKYVLYIS
jgi:transcription elongation factor Elf1